MCLVSTHHQGETNAIQRDSVVLTEVDCKEDSASLAIRTSKAGSHSGQATRLHSVNSDSHRTSRCPFLSQYSIVQTNGPDALRALSGELKLDQSSWPPAAGVDGRFATTASKQSG